jgi:hypothetical protein
MTYMYNSTARLNSDLKGESCETNEGCCAGTGSRDGRCGARLGVR